MIILKSLEIENFRSFKQRASIEFPDKGAILIKGAWSNKAISSGSGKSSILLAIAYALGYCSIPATELKTWGIKGNLFVKLAIKDTDTGDIITITRDPKISIMVNDEPLLGSADELEAKLASRIKTPSELAKTLTYREQRKPGHFVNLTDSKKKEFLVAVLGLDEIEQASDAILQRLKTLDSELSLCQNTITNTQMSVGQSAVSQNDLVGARARVEAARARVKECYCDTAVAGYKTEISQLQAEVNKINELGRKSAVATNQNASIRSQVLSIKADVDKLKEHVCPTCNREWQNGADLVIKKEQDIASLIANMQANLALIRQAESIVGSDAVIKDRINVLSRLIGESTAPKQDALSSLSTAEALERQITSQLNERQRLITLIEQSESRKTILEDDKDTLQHASDVLGREGFLSAIFEEILADIQAQTNAMVAEIPNIELFTVSIPSVKETKKGTVNKNISFDIYKHGHKISIRSVSGGQSAALELLSDLAVSEAIRSRSGSRLGWVALDESMDGLDIETKQSMIGLLKRKVTGQILIVDHATEVKEGFEKVIEVEYDGRESIIV
jgi:DNA repair exonuclease SbcCD ATPase subunit